MATNPIPNVGSGPNKGNGVPPDNGSLKTTAQGAKDAINNALKSNSELQDMLLDSGRK